jgi:hypothetical protein
MVVYELEVYLTIILFTIIFIGVIGNVLNIFVFGKKYMRSVSTFRFLLYLSIINLFVILICTFDDLMSFGFKIQIRLHSTLVCKLHTFMTSWLPQMSSVVLMIVSIDRALVVYNRSKCFNAFCVEKTIATIAAVLIIINLHHLFFFDLSLEVQNIDHFSYEREPDHKMDYYLVNIKPEKWKNELEVENHDHLLFDSNLVKEKNLYYLCYPPSNTIYYFFLISVWKWVDTLVYSILPFLVMIVCSMLILMEIKRKSSASLLISSNLNKIIAQNRTKRNNQILLMLISTNLFFILCSLPYCISNYNVSLDRSDTNSSNSLYIVHILAYSNNAFNFFFYGLFSKKYRDELLKLCHLVYLSLNCLGKSCYGYNGFGQANLNDHLGLDVVDNGNTILKCIDLNEYNRAFLDNNL